MSTEWTPDQIPVPKRVRPKGIADVVFCIDSTGSMAPCIDGVKEHVQNLVEGFTSNQEIVLDWRVRLIEYRDLNQDEEIVPYPFTTDIEEFRKQVQGLTATGGGPEPESTLDAIFVALKSEWREPCNKCVVVFTDAPCHDELHPSTVESGQARDIEEVKNQIWANKARVFLYAPDFQAYRELATVPRVLYEPVAATGLAGVDFAKLLEMLGKTISASTRPIQAA